MPRSRRTSIKTLAIGGVGVGVNAMAPWLVSERPNFAVNTSYWLFELPDKNPAPTTDVL